MRSRAAIVREVGAAWSVEEFELDPPRAGEVLVQMAAAGLCHSDDHIRNGFMSPPGTPTTRPPTIGGHEGSGVVVEVGPGVTGLSAGRVAALLGEHAVPLSEISGHRATLEEAYMGLTRDAVEYRAEPAGSPGGAGGPLPPAGMGEAGR